MTEGHWVTFTHLVPPGQDLPPGRREASPPPPAGLSLLTALPCTGWRRGGKSSTLVPLCLILLLFPCPSPSPAWEGGLDTNRGVWGQGHLSLEPKWAGGAEGPELLRIMSLGGILPVMGRGPPASQQC